MLLVKSLAGLYSFMHVAYCNAQTQKKMSYAGGMLNAFYATTPFFPFPFLPLLPSRRFLRSVVPFFQPPGV